MFVESEPDKNGGGGQESRPPGPLTTQAANPSRQTGTELDVTRETVEVLGLITS
jgi:hypothetical protein